MVDLVGIQYGRSCRDPRWWSSKPVDYVGIKWQTNEVPAP